MVKIQMLFRFICPAILILAIQILEQPTFHAASPPKPPTTGTPKGNSTPGTTRPEAVCKETNQPLTAINANNGNDFTVSASPSFWFYTPYTQDDIKHAEFLLLNGQESTTIYNTAIKLATKPGLIKITLPANLLQPNQNYHWYLMVNCHASHSDEPDAVVDGWVQHKIVDRNLPSDKSQKLTFYTKNNLWYDAVANLAEQHLQYPNNAEIQAAWHDLLKLLGKEWVTQEEFVGAAIP